MKNKLLILAIPLLFGCLAKAKYADESAQIISKIATTVHHAHPGQETAVVKAWAAKHANETSAIFDGKAVLGVIEGIGTSGLLGGAGTLVASLAALFINRKRKNVAVMARKAATEMDPEKAHKILDEAKV